MNILLSLDNYDHGTGGAEMSARALAHQLIARGHHVAVLQRDERVRTYDDGLVHVHTRPLPSSRLLRDRDRDTMRWNRAWRPLLDEFLDAQPTDLILTQNRLLYSTVDAAHARAIPVVVFVRAYGMFCPTKFMGRDALDGCDRQCTRCLPWRFRLKYGTVRRNLDLYERGLRGASLLVANSAYMQAVVRRFLGLDAEVLYPSVGPGDYRADAAAERDGVLFVKPQRVKGLSIFLQIAAQMPERRFLVAGRTRRHVLARMKRRGNIEALGWLDDMRVAYRRARVLLGPSVWPEPFGRVFVEAALNGIPSVASARGGIPEAVGEGGILIDQIADIAQWVEAIRRLDAPALYASCAAKARAHAGRFTPEAGIEQFVQCIQRRLGIAL